MYIAEYYDDAADLDSGDTYIVVVASNTTTGIDAELAVGGGIAGVILAQDSGHFWMISIRVMMRLVMGRSGYARFTG